MWDLQPEPRRRRKYYLVAFWPRMRDADSAVHIEKKNRKE